MLCPVGASSSGDSASSAIFRGRLRLSFRADSCPGAALKVFDRSVRSAGGREHDCPRTPPDAGVPPGAGPGACGGDSERRWNSRRDGRFPFGADEAEIRAFRRVLW